MKSILFLMGVLFLAGCETPFVPIDKLPVFGDPVPGTIHVIAWNGFTRRGHYYLPRGATLGLLIDVAEWKPVRAESFSIPLWGDVWLFAPESHHLSVTHNRGRDSKTDCYVSWLDKKGMPYQHRQRLLLDGDKVERSGFSF